MSELVQISVDVDTSEVDSMLEGLLERIAEGTAQAYTVTLSASVYYAGFVEYGHAVRSGWKVKGPVVGHVPPHPFLRPALHQYASQLAEALASGILDGSALDQLTAKAEEMKDYSRALAPVRTGALQSSIGVDVG